MAGIPHKANRDSFPHLPASEIIELTSDDDELDGAEGMPARGYERDGPSPLAAASKMEERGVNTDKGKKRAPDSESENEVEPLAEAPKHLRRLSNRDNPINLVDSDEEEAAPSGLVAAISGSKPKAKRIIRPIPKRRIRFAQPESEPVAGPSRIAERMEIDSDDSETGSIDEAYVAPKARRASGSLHIDDLLNHENPLAGPSRPRAQLSRVHSPPPPPLEALAAPSELIANALDYGTLNTPNDFLPYVLAILPDMDASWALTRLKVYIASMDKDKVVGSLVTDALDLDGGYPKAEASNAEAGKMKVAATTYADLGHRKDMRAGLQYAERTLAALQDHFPLMPAQHITNTLHLNARLYFPTFWVLREHAARHEKPYAELKNPRASKGAIPKRKERTAEGDIFHTPAEGTPAVSDTQDGGRAEWLLEHDFLERAVERDDKDKAEEATRLAAHAQALAEGGGVECGCCFGDELVENMFQCTEGHLFCKECCIKNAETKLGEQVFTITCMDMSNCSALFPETELARALSSKSLELYFRLKIAAELVLAGIEGLETCPACDYAVVIDNPDEKLFVCVADGCKQVSCRKCRNREHLPKSCEEMEADRKLDKRHAIEDAMTAALVRKCPKCAKPYLKEGGCNKMTCSNCRTISCYICQQAIKDYSHFDQNPTDYRLPKKDGKCHLWDKDEALHDREAIVRARDAAREEVERAAAAEGIQLGEEDLNVAAPERPAAQIHPADVLGVRAGGVNHAVLFANVNHNREGLNEDFAEIRDRIDVVRAALQRAAAPPREPARQPAIRARPRPAPDAAVRLDDRLLLARENARNANLRVRAAFEDHHGVEMARDPGAAAYAAERAARNRIRDRAAPAPAHPGILRAPAEPPADRLPVPQMRMAPVLPRLANLWDLPVPNELEGRAALAPADRLRDAQRGQPLGEPGPALLPAPPPAPVPGRGLPQLFLPPYPHGFDLAGARPG